MCQEMNLQLAVANESCGGRFFESDSFLQGLGRSGSRHRGQLN